MKSSVTSALIQRSMAYSGWLVTRHEQQANEILAGVSPGDEQTRENLAQLLHHAKRPHHARLLREPSFDRFTRFLLESAQDESSTTLSEEDPELLYSLGVWTLHHAGEANLASVLDLVKALRRSGKAELARRLLIGRLWPPPSADETFFQETRAELALCTCLSSDLPADLRLERAWLILNTPPQDDPDRSDGEAPPLEDFISQAGHKRLQRAGFIFRRKWDFQRQRTDLECAKNLYVDAVAKAYEADDRLSALSSAVEVAFQLELLARLDEESGAGPYAEERRRVADEYRREAIEKLASATPTTVLNDPHNHYRWLTSVAQLQLGLYGRARERLGRDPERRPPARSHEAGPDYSDLERLEPGLNALRDAQRLSPIPAWLRDHKAREVAERSRVFGIEPEALDSLVEDRTAVVRSVSVGKVGLALSGGGFRASLFHLGVLARLAELDLLRHVEIVSCVSGGSIVGTHYYLKVRKLLSAKPDAEIDADDYIGLVQELIDEFLAGVQMNIRTRVVSNPLKNLKMLLPGYSRSDRAGDLFERHIFRRVNDGEGRKPRLLSSLKILPIERPGSGDFRPKVHNWKRECKVPILILNATSLNTGHNWQFTTSWMGESPAAIDPEIDANERLRRVKLPEEAPPPHDSIRLGRAVAASACVPGFFEPSTLRQLYERKLVRLVDGGVFDNQGVVSLLEQECRVILVSDASGQMDAEDSPTGGSFGVSMRSNSILMDRVRQTQFRDLRARQQSGQIRGLIYVHLKKDLEVDSVDWIRCHDPKGGSRMDSQLTSYGIRKDLQRKLADIRTDLDSFCDAEAYALMYSGYRMIREKDLKKNLGPLFEERASNGSSRRPGWPFLCVAKPMTDPDHQDEKLARVLSVANHRMFKIFRLWWRSKWSRWILSVLLTLVAGAAIWGYYYWGKNLDSVALKIDRALGEEFGRWLIIGPVVIAILVAFPTVRRWLGRLLQMLLLGVVGLLASWIHLPIFDFLYKRYGRIRPSDGSAQTV